MKFSDIDATMSKVTKKVLNKNSKSAGTPQEVLNNLTKKNSAGTPEKVLKNISEK